MLTETKFKELYQEALRASAVGASAAARERLFYLFDQGRTVGGYGVVRLSFVLRELAGLADLANPGRDAEADQALKGLQQRRSAREALARGAKAGFTELQELVALNQALTDPQRSRALYRELREAGRPELTPVWQTLGSLLWEEMLLQSTPQAIAVAYDLERLKRKLLQLQGQAEAALAAPQIPDDDFQRTLREIRQLIDRYRIILDPLVGRDEDRRRLIELSQDVWALFNSRPVPGFTSDPGSRAALATFAKDLSSLLGRYGVRADLLRDSEIRDQLVRLSRQTAVRICQCRVDEDFPVAELRLLPEHRTILESRILSEGLLAYESLLRITEDVQAEKLASWLLSFRQDGEMYSLLADAAGRVGRSDVESSLNDEARRLLI